MSLARILRDPEAFKDGVLVDRSYAYIFKTSDEQVEMVKKDFLERGAFIHPQKRQREIMIERMTVKRDDEGREIIHDYKKTAYACPDTATHREKYPVLRGEAWVPPAVCVSCVHRVPATLYPGRWSCAMSRAQRKGKSA